MTPAEKYDESTIIGTALNRCASHADKVYLQSRYDQRGVKTDQVHDITWKSMERAIRDVSRGLCALGIVPHDRIAVIGPNTPRWIIAVYGAIAARATFVPIYPTSKTEDVAWCLYDSAAKVVFCQGDAELAKVLAVRKQLAALERIIVMDPSATVTSPDTLSFDSLIQEGAQNSPVEPTFENQIKSAKEEDTAAIIYTSGTTGKPKGVMLTNRNFISQRGVADAFDFRTDDIWLGHLPLCHALGFSVDLLNSGFQGGTLFIADSVETAEMRANLAAVRPTVMTSVPRLWEKLYLQINAIVRGRPKFVQNIFHWSVEVGKARYKRSLEHHPIPLPLRIKSKVAGRVFKRVRKEAGLDRLRISITGGGPIHPDLLAFFGAMGINIYQGYGLTETSPVTHACTPKYNKLGSIGKPIPATECKLASDGELLVRGPQVMSGYFNNEASNEAAFTSDGFFRTGDIAEIDPEGYVRITDRKKELIITSGGKNIPPQPIQNAFNTDPYIEQAYVVGDARKYIAGLIVPNFEYLEKWTTKQGIRWDSKEALIQSERVKALFEERVAKVNATLSSYETIKRFALLPREFTEADGELTPTLKLKRKVIESKYEKIIDSLYPDEKIV